MTATPSEGIERLAEQLRTIDPTLDVRVVPVDAEARLQPDAAPTHELVLGSAGPGSYTINPNHDSATGSEDRFVVHWVGVDYMPGDGDLVADDVTLDAAVRAAQAYEASDANGVTGPERAAGRHAQALADLGSPGLTRSSVTKAEAPRAHLASAPRTRDR